MEGLQWPGELGREKSRPDVWARASEVLDVSQISTAIKSSSRYFEAATPAWGTALRGWFVSTARTSRYAWMIADFALASMTAWMVLLYSYGVLERFALPGVRALSLSAGCCLLLAATLLDLYVPRTLRKWSICLTKAIFTSLLATAGTLALGYFVYFDVPGRRVTLLLGLCLFLIQMLPRVPYLLFRRHLESRVLVIGRSSDAWRLKAIPGYRVVGIWDPEASACPDGQQLAEICQNLGVDEVVLPQNPGQVSNWFDASLAVIPGGCKVSTLATLIEREANEVPIDLVDASWLIGKGWDLRNQVVELAKRAADIVLSLLGLVAGLPLFFLISLMIRLTEKGPVLYSQIRVGRFGMPFRIWKFRTMRVDAEANGAVWAQRNDPRLTWYGKFLRKSRLDEMPQFVNILFGQMSFIGPRPERPEFVARLKEQIPFYDCRHLVRPGLTGWAQVSFRYGCTAEDAKQKLQYDLYYVRHHSILMDAYILIRTLVAVAKGAQ